MLVSPCARESGFPAPRQNAARGPEKTLVSWPLDNSVDQTGFKAPGKWSVRVGKDVDALGVKNGSNSGPLPPRRAVGDQPRRGPPPASDSPVRHRGVDPAANRGVRRPTGHSPQHGMDVRRDAGRGECFWGTCGPEVPSLRCVAGRLSTFTPPPLPPPAHCPPRLPADYGNERARPADPHRPIAAGARLAYGAGDASGAFRAGQAERVGRRPGQRDVEEAEGSHADLCAQEYVQLLRRFRRPVRGHVHIPHRLAIRAEHDGQRSHLGVDPRLVRRRTGPPVPHDKGAAGVVLGLAARPGLQNVISALIIGEITLAAADRLPSRSPTACSHGMTLDDELVVENEFGRVEDIKSQYVVFRIWDGRRMILPLSYFTAKPFQNWTKTSTWKIGTVFFYFAPLILSRMGQLREQVVRLLTTNDDARRLWDGKVFSTQVTNVMQDGGVVEVRVLASAAKGGDAFDLRCLVREHVIAFVVDKWPDVLVRSRNEARMFADEANVWDVGDSVDDDADAGNSKAVVEKEVFEHAKGE
ncbi:MAG: hypothetical protein BJ554DRAFT_3529 [Olpidium bornovanus]|uniref:Mechanosensitive ion channel MscS domain-containing protein n=1 Tax=Olpidium bornovanus TaxID=278681 RepID=A0A8H8A0K7_9FUNG|nr:MAG: hypothetical protein BJ554DRAFT_3529 [Olpidium bornovanus]